MSCVIKMKGTRHLSDKKSNLVSLYQQLHSYKHFGQFIKITRTIYSVKT